MFPGVFISEKDCWVPHGNSRPVLRDQVFWERAHWQKSSGEAGGEGCGHRCPAPVGLKWSHSGSKVFLSARYMLEGMDAAGNACRIFVENQGGWDTGFKPSIVTDSPLLAGWETAALTAAVEGIPEGVMIRILRKAD